MAGSNRPETGFVPTIRPIDPDGASRGLFFSFQDLSPKLTCIVRILRSLPLSGIVAGGLSDFNG